MPRANWPPLGCCQAALGAINLMESNRKGGGKTGKKINMKREEKLKRDLQEAVQARDRAKSKTEKKALQKLVDHIRGQMGKSETHWRR